MYDEALAALSALGEETKELLVKQAYVYFASGNVPAAIKCIEKALMTNKSDAGLWVALAVYYRMDYDFQKAQAAVSTALNIDPFNEKALLENARIKKSLGKTKEYQEVLKNILSSLKKKYREPGV
jgi:Tfp pilus assembly protein PilF